MNTNPRWHHKILDLSTDLQHGRLDTQTLLNALLEIMDSYEREFSNLEHSIAILSHQVKDMHAAFEKEKASWQQSVL